MSHIVRSLSSAELPAVYWKMGKITLGACRPTAGTGLQTDQPYRLHNHTQPHHQSRAQHTQRIEGLCLGVHELLGVSNFENTNL